MFVDFVVDETSDFYVSSCYEVERLTKLWRCVESGSVEDFYIAIYNKERQMASTPIPNHS